MGLTEIQQHRPRGQGNGHCEAGGSCFGACVIEVKCGVGGVGGARVGIPTSFLKWMVCGLQRIKRDQTKSSRLV